MDFKIIAVSPYGRNVNNYLDRAIDEIKPNIVAIATSPYFDFGISMQYAFSVYNCVGIPIDVSVSIQGDSELDFQYTIYPGRVNETVVDKCWLNKIPLIPIGMPYGKKRKKIFATLVAFPNPKPLMYR